MSKLKLVAIGVPVFLILGLITGLSRFGLFPTDLSIHHGVLMLNGFAGGLITLERTLSKPVLANFISLIMLVVGVILASLDMTWGLWLVTGAIILLILAEVQASRTHHWAYHLMQLTGLLCWLTANAKYQFSNFYPAAVPFWQAFVLMMILATRLKKIDRISDLTVMLVLGLYIVSICLPFHSAASSLTGVLLITLAAVVLRLELRHSDDQRYRLMIVYGWLIATAIGMLLSDQILNSYDFVLHSFFLGFLFNMIFLNASKAIVSKFGVIGIPLAESLWMIIMTAGLLIRIVPGDVLGIEMARVVGGIISILAILGFLGSVIRSVVLTRMGRAT
ncbi:MAG: hypothetical protein RIC80_12370 [Cyclobacteriaceae bacterium]